MEKSGLVQLIQSLSAVEKREMGKFLDSPFFNQRTDVVQLFQHLCSNTSLTKTAVWAVTMEATPYDDSRMRLLMSYLLQLLEQYLAVKELQARPLEEQHLTALAYRRRSMRDAAQKNWRKLETNLEKQPLRNLYYHELRFKLLWETQQAATSLDPTDTRLLSELATAANVLGTAKQLRVLCIQTAQQSVYASADSGWNDDWVQQVTEGPLAQTPSVAAYLHCYNMLRHPTNDSHFQLLKNIILHQNSRFDADEMHGIYILAINYCVKKINSNTGTYTAELMDIYKEGLAQNYLLENGILSRFTYHNVVAAGISSGEYEWVRYFINHYRNNLEKQYREPAFSYNLARLEYAQRNFGFVLELLQKANYRDILLNLQAKTLLLKTYHELGELDSLDSHLDAMRNYVHRKAALGYHRTNYLNIIKYMDKILRLNRHDKAAVQHLRERIQNEEILTERGYLLMLVG